MINLQIDIQMFSESIPEVFLTLLILLPTKISPLPTQVQPGKVWKLLIRDVLKEHQDQVLCFGVGHVIHSNAELGHEDVVLDGRSAQEQDRLVALFNILVDSVEVVHAQRQVVIIKCNSVIVWKSSVQSWPKNVYSPLAITLQKHDVDIVIKFSLCAIILDFSVSENSQL